MAISCRGKGNCDFEKIHLKVSNLALFLVEELYKKANLKNFMDVGLI